MNAIGRNHLQHFENVPAKDRAFQATAIFQLKLFVLSWFAHMFIGFALSDRTRTQQ